MSASADPAARRAFWQYVDKSGDCWLWQGPTNGRYGRIGRRTYAHRVSYEMAHGPIPVGLFVMHTCDVPLCVRPEHLTLGTNRDNMQDAKAKKRLATGALHGLNLHPEARATGKRHGTKTMPWRVSKGSKRPAAKLTDANVREIRRRSDAGETRAQLAREFGVTPTVIRRIATREAWRHVI